MVGEGERGRGKELACHQSFELRRREKWNRRGGDGWSVTGRHIEGRLWRDKKKGDLGIKDKTSRLVGQRQMEKRRKKEIKE